jgi:hypothetical protein
MRAVAERAEVTVEQVVREPKLIGFSDIRKVVSWRNELVSLYITWPALSVILVIEVARKRRRTPFGTSGLMLLLKLFLQVTVRTSI